MLPQIREINFPSYATLHQATVNLADMGEKVITAQVKIDGAVRPSFVGRTGTDAHGEDWEIEFRGERYIQPLRKPQALKDNSSVCSMIDLTFHHWAIYQLKRYFFVALANVDSGTPIVDKYIAPLGVDLPNFARALADMLKYYFPKGEVYVYKENGSYINPDFHDYDPQTKYIEIDHTYIWDVLQKTYELYQCRWAIVKDADGNYAIKFGYPLNIESSHIFKYGYDGGLLSLERQVQDDNIRNQLLGRGGSKNLPYMYFKDYERFHPNSEDSAYKNIGLPDPDAIPELENILFSELRDTNFRSYVQGWKVNVNRQSSTGDGWAVTNDGQGNFTESNGDTYSLDTERLETDWAYAKGATDKKFDPVEYVKDDESIATYGLLQGGLANDEDVFPTLQGVELELPCIKGAHDDMAAEHDVRTLADEVVDVEEVVTDAIRTAEDGTNQKRQELSSPDLTVSNVPRNTTSVSNPFTFTIPDQGFIELETNPFDIEQDYFGNILQLPRLNATAKFRLTADVVSNGVNLGTLPAQKTTLEQMDYSIVNWGVYEYGSDTKLDHTTNIPAGRYYIKAKFRVLSTSFSFKRESLNDGRIVNTPNGISGGIDIVYSLTGICDSYNFDGEVVANADLNGIPISASETIAAHDKDTILLTGDSFHVPAQGAINVECPVKVTPETTAIYETSVRILNTTTHQYVDGYNIPEGDYQFRIEVNVTNDSDSSVEFTATLGPAFVYFNHEYEDWKPTFDIWIKNVFQTNRGDYESDDEYMRAVWEPLVATQDMTVTFSTGNLSSHSDWEFKVASEGIHYDNSKTLIVKDEDGVEHEVRSEWRLTLIKSDAEADSIHKYVPYKDFNAAPYDRFYFTNIYLPWAYVYAAEKLLNANKEEQLVETKEVQPTWVVKVDKIRLQQLNKMWSIQPGDKVWIKDSRFTEETGVQLYVESMSYNWQGDGANLPDLEIVLSDKVATALSTVEKIQGDIKELSSQVKGLSRLERAIRAVGDAVYLRKDGFEDTSYSPTNIARSISSSNYRPGIVGGRGWSSYADDDGKGVLEIDRLLVREDLQVNNLVINQVSSFGGKEVLSAASMTISAVEPTEEGFKCHFEQHNGSIGNLFVVDDIALSQVWDSVNQETKFYKRAVVEVGADYIVLSYDNADGNGSPAVGDVVAQYGNLTNADRQYVIIRDVVGGGYEQMLWGLDSVNASGEEYYFAGVKSFGTRFVGLEDNENSELYDKNGLRLGYEEPDPKPRWFVGNHAGQYAQFEDGVLTVKGVINVVGGNLQYLISGLSEGESGTSIAGGIVLSSIIGVRDMDSPSEIVAALNGSDDIEGFVDNTHGILILAAGIPNGDLEHAYRDAATRIFYDGTIITNSLIATSANISGTVTTDNLVATGGTIGGILIRSDGLGINNDPGAASGNGVTLNDSFIIFNGTNSDTLDKSFVGVGRNVLPGTAAITALARLTLSRDTVDYIRPGYGIMIDVSGFVENIAIQCNNGQFYGLRPKVVRTTDSEITLTAYDFIVIVNSYSNTVKLPTTPKDGQTYFIYRASSGSGGQYIDPQGNKIYILGGSGSFPTTPIYIGVDASLSILTYSKSFDSWILRVI